MPGGEARPARLVVLRAPNAQNFTHADRTGWHVAHLRDRLPDAGFPLPETVCGTVGGEPRNRRAGPSGASHSPRLSERRAPQTGVELLHRDPAGDGDGDVALHLDTQVGFLYGSYRLVVSLDMTCAQRPAHCASVLALTSCCLVRQARLLRRVLHAPHRPV